MIEPPESGEVSWSDQVGVTCRRWNWRQGIRTRITADSSSAVFMLDALDPLPDAELHAAADALSDGLRALCPDAVIHWELISAVDRTSGPDMSFHAP